MPTKEELVERARELGVADADRLNKDELEARIAGVEAAGPIVPEGETQPAPAEQHGKVVTGVQPVEEDDVPEAGR